jgi:hypothetical protein
MLFERLRSRLRPKYRAKFGAKGASFLLPFPKVPDQNFEKAAAMQI